jgi:hypothetical protein
MYDPTTDVWTAKTSKPIWGYGNSLTTLDNKLVVCFEQYSSILISPPAGFSEQRTVRIIMIYDPETDTWSEKATSGQIFNSFFAAAEVTTGLYVPQKIFFIESTSTTVYDPKSDIWSTAKAMPTERKDFAIVALDDTLYVIGGEKTSTLWNILMQLFRLGSLAVTEQYLPLDYSGTISTTTPEPFMSRTVIAATVLITCVVVAILFFYFKKVNKNNNR